MWCQQLNYVLQQEKQCDPASNSPITLHAYLNHTKVQDLTFHCDSPNEVAQVLLLTCILEVLSLNLAQDTD
jgi:hypothetical protein